MKKAIIAQYTKAIDAIKKLHEYHNATSSQLAEMIYNENQKQQAEHRKDLERTTQEKAFKRTGENHDKFTC